MAQWAVNRHLRIFPIQEDFEVIHFNIPLSRTWEIIRCRLNRPSQMYAWLWLLCVYARGGIYRELFQHSQRFRLVFLLLQTFYPAYNKEHMSSVSDVCVEGFVLVLHVCRVDCVQTHKSWHHSQGAQQVSLSHWPSLFTYWGISVIDNFTSSHLYNLSFFNLPFFLTITY